MLQLIENSVEWIKNHPLIILPIIYFFLWINLVHYLVQIYRLDIKNLEKRKKVKVAAVTTNSIRNGTSRYAAGIAQGEIKAAENESDEEIRRRKLKFFHELINSFISVVTNFFKK